MLNEERRSEVVRGGDRSVVCARDATNGDSMLRLLLLAVMQVDFAW